MPATVALKLLPCPPAMPPGTVNVMFRVNDPLTICAGETLRKNVPRLFEPPKAPTPRTVVAVKLAFPSKVSWGTPEALPVAEPKMVTSLARAAVCPRIRNVIAVRHKKSDLPTVRMRHFLIQCPPHFVISHTGP
jgi:hypothetical protein